MEKFDLIEADFQQYYQINLLEYLEQGSGFRRFSRLFSNLPAESRVFLEYMPEASWTHDQEMLSEILLVLQNFKVSFANANRRKGSPAIHDLQLKDQYQPDYVREAKERERDKREKNNYVSFDEYLEITKEIDAMNKT